MDIFIWRDSIVKRCVTPRQHYLQTMDRVALPSSLTPVFMSAGFMLLAQLPYWDYWVTFHSSQNIFVFETSTLDLCPMQLGVCLYDMTPITNFVYISVHVILPSFRVSWSLNHIVGKCSLTNQLNKPSFVQKANQQPVNQLPLPLLSLPPPHISNCSPFHETKLKRGSYIIFMNFYS